MRANIKAYSKLMPRPNGRHFAEDIFQFIFLNEKVSIANEFSFMVVPKGPTKQYWLK